MKTLHDVTCKRCGCTTSGMWIDPDDLVAAHACPDGGRSDSFAVTARVVSGPGERGRDDVTGNHSCVLMQPLRRCAAVPREAKP